MRVDNPESIIDDNTGSGDTNKVWSADKVYTEVEGVRVTMVLLSGNKYQICL